MPNINKKAYKHLSFKQITEKSKGYKIKLNKKAISSSFDDFLEEENILAESDAIAIKRAVAFEVQKSMEEEYRYR